MARLIVELDRRLPSHTRDSRRIAVSAAAGSLQTSNCFMISFISVSICTHNENRFPTYLFGFLLANFILPFGSHMGKRCIYSIS